MLILFLFPLWYSLKLECEKLASEKTEMQRHYVMVMNSTFSSLSAMFIDYFLSFFFSPPFFSVIFTIVLRDVVRPQRRNAQTGNLIRYRLQITRLNFYRLYSRLRSKLAFFFFTSVVLISRADAIQTF